jgi:hypothetical protein
MSSIYYIYSYLRDDGTPYYIGKGKDKRAWTKGKGEIYPPKDKSKIVIMENNLTEIGALALERRYILWYGRKDLQTGILRNLTSGGDGTSGRKVSEETRLKISKSSLGRVFSPRTEQSKNLTRNSLLGKKHTEERKKKLSESRKGMKLKDSVRNVMGKKFQIIKPNGEKLIVNNLNKFCQENKLSRSLMRKVAQGKSSNTKGWKCYYFLSQSGTEIK